MTTLNKPLISFVIPMRNGEKTIVRCLNSILTQKTDFLFEVIVVDNGSTDSSLSQIKGFPIVVVSEITIGRSHARNAGISAAQSEWVAFIDCDVVLEEDWLDKMIVHVIKNGNIDGAIGSITPGKLKDSMFEKYRFDLFLETNIAPFGLKEPEYFLPIINSSACLYRRKSLLSVGGFEKSLMTMEDLDLCWRIWCHGGAFAVIPSAKATVYWDKGSFVSYLKRYFYVGIGSNSLYALWNSKRVFSWKNTNDIQSIEKLMFFSMNNLRLFIYYFGVLFHRVYKNTLLNPEKTSLNRSKQAYYRRYRYKNDKGEGVLIILSESTRVFWTPLSIKLIQLSANKVASIPLDDSVSNPSQVASELWSHHERLVREGYLFIFSEL